MKRAITLAGGGPTAGLHIGALERLTQAGITFDVWSLSCIGAWVGLVWNQCDRGREVEQTYDFFKNGVFRDDVSYSRFPINSVFGPDWFGNMRALSGFLMDHRNYQNLWLPDRMTESFKQTMSLLSDRDKWNEGDFNQWVLNHAFASNPAVRFMTAMMYLSNITGLSKIYYPDSAFMKSIKFDRLFQEGKPKIYHNAWNLSRQQLELFSNQDDDGYKDISAATLCACSALPFIEGTVEIDGETYCEGALVDTVSFKSLLEDHPELEEIWISRIVDAKQVRKPENLHDNLANLCQLFAATVGEDDVKLFKYHVRDSNWKGTIVEMHVDAGMNFKWAQSNLDTGRKRGYLAADRALKEYEKHRAPKGEAGAARKLRIINEMKDGPELRAPRRQHRAPQPVRALEAVK